MREGVVKERYTSERRRSIDRGRRGGGTNLHWLSFPQYVLLFHSFSHIPSLDGMEEWKGKNKVALEESPVHSLIPCRGTEPRSLREGMMTTLPPSQSLTEFQWHLFPFNLFLSR